jgi:hypothetical protein
VAFLQDLVLCFENDVKDLLSQPNLYNDPRAIQVFIDTCKLNCTGNLNWRYVGSFYSSCVGDVTNVTISLSTQRYGVKDNTGEDGKVVFVLE